MFRRDWSVLAALVGCLILAGFALLSHWAGQPNEHGEKLYASAQRYNSTSATEKPFAAYPVEESNRCYSAPDHDSADLCAQWRAAIAAEKAADAAAFSNTLSIIGAVLSAVGLGALLVTIRQGRRALRRAAKANRIAQRIGEAQTRAYLTISNVEGFHSRNGISIEITVQNSGQSPALEVTAHCAIMGNDDVERSTIQNATVSIPTTAHQTLSKIFYVSDEFRDWKSIVVKARVGYADVFNEIHSISEIYGGSPEGWTMENGTGLIRRQDLISVMDAGLDKLP